MSGALSVLCHLSEKVVDFSSKDDNLNLQKKKRQKGRSSDVHRAIRYFNLPTRAASIFSTISLRCVFCQDPKMYDSVETSPQNDRQ